MASCLTMHKKTSFSRIYAFCMAKFGGPGDKRHGRYINLGKINALIFSVIVDNEMFQG